MANDITGVRSTLGGPAIPLSASVANAIEQSRESWGARNKKLAYIGGGVLAAAALVAIAWSQMPRAGSPNLQAADVDSPILSTASSRVIANTTPLDTRKITSSVQPKDPRVSPLRSTGSSTGPQEDRLAAPIVTP